MAAPDTDTDPDAANEALRAAAEKVRTVLTMLSVDVVVSVDDFWTLGAGSLDQIREMLVTSGAFLPEVVRELTRAGVMGKETDPASPEAVSDLLTLVWADLDLELQKDLARAAAIHADNIADGVPEGMARIEVGAPARLQEMVSDSAKFIGIGLAQWRAMSAEVSEDTQGTLVLFDKDFSNENGGDATTGESLLRDLLSNPRDGLRAGMLTRTAKSEDDELSSARNLAGELSVDPGRVVVIGKFRLANVTFPGALRVLLLADEIEAFIALAKRALRESHDRAERKLDGLQRYTIAGAMASAAKEGTFELDQPLRILDQIQEETLIEIMRDEEFAKTHLPRLRSGSLESYLSAADAGAQIAEVLRADLFVSADFVNIFGLSIEIGDIFEFKSVYPATKARPVPPPRFFVLLAQACDISMRPGGVRTPDIATLVLHEFRRLAVDPEGIPRGAFARLHQVGQFVTGTDEVWGINFGTRIAVPALAIDATVFNADGSAAIAVDTLDKRPMADSWVMRQLELQRQAKFMVEQQKKVETSLKKSDVRDDTILRVGASLTGASMSTKTGVTAAIDTTTATVTYGLERVGRIRSATAVGLVALANAYDARPAFDPQVSVAGI